MAAALPDLMVMIEIHDVCLKVKDMFLPLYNKGAMIESLSIEAGHCLMALKVQIQVHEVRT
jgi:hypothetical protein